MTTSERPSQSLVAALTAAGVPAENHQFIRMFTDAVGIDEYHFVDRAGKPYVVASRRDGLRPLHIYYGATNGFSSEDEVIRMAGPEADRRESGTRPGTWCVEHPLNKSRPPGSPSPKGGRVGSTCGCGMQRSLNGECPSCD